MKSSWDNIEQRKKQLQNLYGRVKGKQKSEILRLMRGYNEVSQPIITVPEWGILIKDKQRECQVCGNKDNLHAHHILYRSNYPLLRYNINNGITLCVNCHAEVHTGETVYGLIISKKTPY
jgi:5-methylcytosine-specific restriction endonuclease McrA